ncbi:MAG TPA: alpha/beta hydrolase [Gammaproteobacteria bacterium]|jgi:pimeloyl-ACP methyl ester carboxylesterase|nr:alpha/beta hydrolase [Gammaproteobacteria bacterium]
MTTGRYLAISDDVNLFYRESGTGETLLFIPGWTLSSDVFQSQVDYFSKKYRVITMDPRSHGRSDITLRNNNYTQHGIDLVNFIDKLHLKNITLICWSWGCHDAYAYMRLKGTDNIKAFVCIDGSPKASGTKDEWAFLNYEEWGKKIVQPLMYNRYEFIKTWAQDMVERPLQPHEIDWITGQSTRTPAYAALEMLLDAIYSDYRQEVILLDQHHIPTMSFISKDVYPAAKLWLEKNAPHNNVQALGKHMMFWEYADQFNQTLDAFLQSALSGMRDKTEPRP